MSLRVAITRAAPGSQYTAERLRAMGMIAVLAPLLSIESVRFDADLAHVQALLFTSANGVRAFAARSGARGIAALTVGEATAAVARAAGFTNVRAAADDVAALTSLAMALFDPRAGKLLHISGAHVAGDLAGPLSRAGFDVEQRVAYEAKAATRAPDCLHQPLDAVLFHSSRAAQAFVRLGAPQADRLTALCLSAAVAEAAGKAPWQRLIVASAPREDALLEAALGI